MDAFTARALDLITSTKARDAFDLEKEPEKVRAGYGQKDDKYIYVGNKADTPWYGHQFLLARRLVDCWRNWTARTAFSTWPSTIVQSDRTCCLSLLISR